MDERLIIHLIKTEPEARVPGGIYPTLCGTTTVHAELTVQQQRRRVICALCQSTQNLELVTAFEELRTHYNQHLQTYHLEK